MTRGRECMEYLVLKGANTIQHLFGIDNNMDEISTMVIDISRIPIGQIIGQLSYD